MFAFKTDIFSHLTTKWNSNKCYRILKGQSKMDNPEKLATYGTQDEEKLSIKHSTICVGHHYAQTNIM